MKRIRKEGRGRSSTDPCLQAVVGFPLGHQTIIKKRPQEGNKTQAAGAATVRVCALSLRHLPAG